MRPLRWVIAAVVLALPRPADAKMAVARAAVGLCRCEGVGGDEEQILLEAAGHAIGPVVRAIARFPGGDDDCTHAAYELAVRLLCEEPQLAAPPSGRPAVTAVRAALASSSWDEVSIALDLLAGLRPPPRTSTNHLRPCEVAGPILASVAPDLGKLLNRTPPVRRLEVLDRIKAMELGATGGPLVPALVRLLDDRYVQERAAGLLRTIGPPAAPAAPRLGKLLAAAGDLHTETVYASAIAAIRAPSPAAATALPARLDEAERTADAAPRRFRGLFDAAVAAGPPAGRSAAEWNGALVARARAAFARMGPTFREPRLERDLLVALSRLPRTPEQVALLESAMSDPKASVDRRFWAAWALRALGAPLSPAAATTQAELVGPPERPLLPAPEPDGPLPPLQSPDLFAALRAVRAKVAACYARDKVAPVAAQMQLEIAYGRVVSATVVDGLAGTPTAACIESAVRTATFPIAERINPFVPVSPD